MFHQGNDTHEQHLTRAVAATASPASCTTVSHAIPATTSAEKHLIQPVQHVQQHVQPVQQPIYQTLQHIVVKSCCHSYSQNTRPKNQPRLPQRKMLSPDMNSSTNLLHITVAITILHCQLPQLTLCESFYRIWNPASIKEPYSQLDTPCFSCLKHLNQAQPMR